MALLRYVYGGEALGMGRAEEYRWFAVRCVEIARITAHDQTKAAMLQMAQVWSRLADEQSAPRQDIAHELNGSGAAEKPSG